MEFHCSPACTEKANGLTALFLSGVMQSSLAAPLVSRYLVPLEITNRLSGGDIKPWVILYMRLVRVVFYNLCVC